MADTCYTPVVRLPKSKNSSSSTQSISNYPVEPRDMIVSETLNFDGLAGAISEMDLHHLLQAYPPLEVVIHQDGDSGYLRFSDAKTADRVYSLFNGFTFPNNSSKLQIQISGDENESIEHEPKGPILEVKGLPNGIDNDGLYDLFRPFGPLSLCKPIVIGRAFRGTAFVQYFFQTHSDEALDHLNNKSLDDGTTLSVAAFMPSKIRNTDYQQASKNSAASLAPSSLDKSESYVDYMNLYIKNLEPHIDNDALFHLFRRFGHIVSARVMSNPVTGHSKGYGFVSYDKPEEAAAALHEMNGKVPPSCMKPLMVAFHEPKKPRQEKQQQQQHHQQHLGTSPIPNALQPVQHQHQHQPFMTPIGAPVRVPPHAADYASNAMSSMAGSTGISMPYDNRHPYDMTTATTTTTAANIPSQMNGLGIDSVDQIALNIKSIGQKRPSPPQQVHRKFSAAESNFGQHPLRLSPPFSTSPLSGVSSTGPSLASLAGMNNVQPRPPNIPPPQQQQQQPDYRTANGRPTLRRKGSLESVSSIMTESSASMQRQRLVEAVMRCGDYAKSVNDIVDMLLTLKRKERSLCLFNQDFLRDKIELALIALETFNEEEQAQQEQDDYAHNVPGAMDTDLSPSMIKATIPPRVSKAIPIVAPPPESPATKKSMSPTSQQQQQPTTTTPRTASATNGSAITTTNTTTTTNNNNDNTADIESLLASLEGKPVHEKKQQLGDRLFPLVKATGTKQAPKVTIRLLDSIDLHELAHLMYDKDKLKERVEVAFASLK
ncbi:hypothetical protein K492DRAFT_150031 [Lichtheimia hyalospora FSU 10163]|nr:hypothetical protein K492DRAFT_150031 [Lichtheimia hyalospora FSU 10163]